MPSIDELLSFSVFSEDQVQSIGISMVARRRVSNPSKVFHSHFGSTAAVLSDQFMDLQTTNIEGAKLTKEDNSEEGLRSFLAAHYWLWTRPKNADLMASHLGLPEKQCCGEPLWRWVRFIHHLRPLKILWDKQGNANRDVEVFSLTVDGTDFKTWEPKHPTRPIDTKYASHKFKSAGLRYELGISVKTGRCVWIHGPFPAGTHDMTIFWKALKYKIGPKEAVIADRGYQTSRKDEKFMSTPSKFDDPEVDKFKSRARCRHEAYNGRIKHFASMEQTWKHSQEKHMWAFTAVVVTIEYQLEHGSLLFDA